jgi:uncharacterized protein (UPF0335 family)
LKALECLAANANFHTARDRGEICNAEEEQTEEPLEDIEEEIEDLEGDLRDLMDDDDGKG